MPLIKDHLKWTWPQTNISFDQYHFDMFVWIWRCWMLSKGRFLLLHCFVHLWNVNTSEVKTYLLHILPIMVAYTVQIRAIKIHMSFPNEQGSYCGYNGKQLTAEEISRRWIKMEHFILPLYLSRWERLLPIEICFILKNEIWYEISHFRSISTHFSSC